MRNKVTTALSLCAVLAFGQHGSEKVFITDPYQSNGFFILDDHKMDQLGADRVSVEIIIRSNELDGSVSETRVETLELDVVHPWAKADASLIQDLPDGSVAVYSVTALAGSTVVYDENEWNPGPIGWPRCQQVCSGNRYGWRMTLISDGFWTDIDFTNPGLYFYVPAEDWDEFKDNNPASSLGLSPWYIYDNVDNPVNVECFKLQERPANAYGANGNPLAPYEGPVWAIRKDKGAWRGLDRSSHHVGLGAMCDDNGMNLKEFYNYDSEVIADITNLPAQPNPGEVSCPNGELSPGFEPTENSLEVNCFWVEFLTSVAVQNDEGQIEILEEVMRALHCEEDGENGTPWGHDHPLGEIGLIAINHWDNGTSVPKLTIKIPEMVPGKPLDPKLIKVQKTELPVGLYEILMVNHDGTMRRHFEEVKTPVVVGSSFAAFVSNTIYPVPVKDKSFAIDFDLMFPMNVNLTIVNNMGTVYNTAALAFNIAGKNKHVVYMENGMWPNGQYHAIFHYPDGSSESTSFLVEQ